jgi:hypothetical protein
MKDRKCKARACGVVFLPQRMGQHACSPLCAIELARAKREQAETRKRSDERKADRQKRESLKTRRDYINEAQHAFNRYVRLRDAARPCICCGRPLQSAGTGGLYDAGHYRSVGSAPHLRFEPDNCHGQTKQCNRYGAGRAVDYRLGLIERIGLARVEALEADQIPRKWSREELIAIRDEFRAKARELENQT